MFALAGWSGRRGRSRRSGALVAALTGAALWLPPPLPAGAADAGTWRAAAAPGIDEGKAVLLEGSESECGPACGKVLLVGVQGDAAAPTAAAAAVYDPAADRWSPVAAPSGLFPRSLTVLRGTTAQCGARCGQVLVKFTRGVPLWGLYDPKSDSWSATTAPAFPRRLGASTTLISGSACGSACGRVLVAGGQNDQGPQSSKVDNERSLQSAEIYDPTTNGWSLTGVLGAPAFDDHLASALPDGRVLVAGGGLGGGAKVYDPAAGRWTDAAAPATTRVKPFAAMTTVGGSACEPACGKVLAVGGDGGPELYDASAGGGGAWAPTGPCPACTGEPRVALADDGVVLVVTSTGTSRYDAAANAWQDLSPIPRKPSLGDLVVISGSGRVCGERCGTVLAVAATSSDLYFLRSSAGPRTGDASTSTPPGGDQPAGGRSRIGLAAAGGMLIFAAAAGGAIVVQRRRRAGNAG